MTEKGTCYFTIRTEITKILQNKRRPLCNFTDKRHVENFCTYNKNDDSLHGTAEQKKLLTTRHELWSHCVFFLKSKLGGDFILIPSGCYLVLSGLFSSWDSRVFLITWCTVCLLSVSPICLMFGSANSLPLLPYCLFFVVFYSILFIMILSIFCSRFVA